MTKFIKVEDFENFLESLNEDERKRNKKIIAELEKIANLPSCNNEIKEMIEELIVFVFVSE